MQLIQCSSTIQIILGIQHALVQHPPQFNLGQPVAIIDANPIQFWVIAGFIAGESLKDDWLYLVISNINQDNTGAWYKAKQLQPAKMPESCIRVVPFHRS